MAASRKILKKLMKTKVSKPRKRYKREVYKSSGNIFKDMGKSDEEATNLLMRSMLMIEIEEAIRDRAWTQTQAAKFLGVAQPRIAELFASRIDLFTLDTLIKYLNKLGKQVTLTVQDGKVA